MGRHAQCCTVSGCYLYLVKGNRLKADKVTGESTQLCDEKINDTYFSYIVFRVKLIKSRRLGLSRGNTLFLHLRGIWFKSGLGYRFL